MTAQQALNPKAETIKRTMLGYGCNHIIGTTGVKATSCPQKWRQSFLVGPHHEN